MDGGRPIKQSRIPSEFRVNREQSRHWLHASLSEVRPRNSSSAIQLERLFGFRNKSQHARDESWVRV
jgi:hypothetical protein